MFEFIFKIFIKNHKDIGKKEICSKYGLICSYISIFLNFTLFLTKLFVGIVSNGISIIADSFNNLSDSLSCIISAIGIKFSSKPPDKEHPLGHGRYEYISALIISFLIILVGISFLKSSFNKIFVKEEIFFNWILLSILIVSILIKLFISILNFSISKKINSQILKTTAVDSLYDSLITIMLLICFTLSNSINIYLDGYAGIIVSSFIIHSGIKLIKETLNPLLGEAPSRSFVINLESSILKYENILGLHDLIVHNYGPNKIIASIHAEVPSNLSLINIHNLIDMIEKEIERNLGIHLVIHIDPVEIHDKENLDIYKNISSLIKKNIIEINNILDFRILNTNGKDTIYFEVKMKNEFYNNDTTDIIKTCENLVNKHYPEFDCKVFRNNIIS